MLMRRNTEQTHYIKRARKDLLLEFPFFGSLALRLKVCVSNGVDTLEVTPFTLFYNPDFIKNKTRNFLKFAVAHEVLHIALKHHLRRQGKDINLYNVACDYVVNLILSESGFKVPAQALLDFNFTGQSAEQVYNFLLEQRKNNDSSNQGSNENFSNDSKEDSNKSLTANSTNNSNQDSNKDSNQDSNKNPDQDSKNKSNPQGEQNYNTKATKEEQESIKHFGTFRQQTKEEIDDEKTTEYSLKDQEKNWQQYCVEANMVSNNMRSTGLKRELLKMSEPKIQWQEILEQFLVQSINTDYNWNIPNRRYLQSGIYLPSMTQKSLSNIFLAIDTSGSIDDEMLGMFVQEVNNIFPKFDNCTFTVLYCDNTIHGEPEIIESYPFELNPKGGGGTSFDPVFNFIENNTYDIDCLIYFTDCRILRYPERQPYFPVVWVEYKSKRIESWGTKRYGKPPFGEHIQIK